MDNERIANILLESNIKWGNDFEITAESVGQTIDNMNRFSGDPGENGLTVDVGGILMKKYRDRVFVYAYIGRIQ